MSASHAPGREQQLPHRNFQRSPSPPSEELRDPVASPKAMAMPRDRSRASSVAQDDELELSPPTRSMSTSSQADAASPRSHASPVPMDISRQLPHPSTSRYLALRPNIPSLSTVTQLPPLRWDPRVVASGPRELIESIEDLRELRHVLREERVQTIKRLEDLDYRVAAAETKIHLHLQQEHGPSSVASSSHQQESPDDPRMLSPPSSPEDFRRSLTLPRLREHEPCRYRSEEEEALLGSMDRIKIGVTPEPHDRPPASRDWPQFPLPQIRPVADWTQDTASYTSSYQISYSRRSGSRSPSESPEQEPIVLPQDDNVRYPSPTRDNSISAALRHREQDVDESRPALVQPQAEYRPFTSPLYRAVTRDQTPERRVFSPESVASVASSSSTLQKRGTDQHDESEESDDDTPLSKVVSAPPAKRPRLSRSPSPPPQPAPIATVAAPAAPILQHHQSTFTFVGTTVVPDPSRRRLVTKRQSRPGKIPCDYVAGPDEAACPMRFTRHADMVRHRESIHGAQQGKYRCPVCSKSLSRADAVKRHILGATDYIHADFVAKRGREIDGGGDWWRTLVEADGQEQPPLPAPVPISS